MNRINNLSKKGKILLISIVVFVFLLIGGTLAWLEWDSEKEDYYFSVVDVISALTDNDYQKSRNYWKWLKNKLSNEGSELVSTTNQLKMRAKDGKLRDTDTLDTEGIFRLIESVPSPKAEPFKLWLAKLGKERIDEVFDPEIAIKRSIEYYKRKGYTDAWIEARIE